MKFLKPTDKAMESMASEFPGRNERERPGSLVTIETPMAEPLSGGRRQHVSSKFWMKREMTHWRGFSDSMETRTHHATGETLLTPGEIPGTR